MTVYTKILTPSLIFIDVKKPNKREDILAANLSLPQRGEPAGHLQAES